MQSQQQDTPLYQHTDGEAQNTSPVQPQTPDSTQDNSAQPTIPTSDSKLKQIIQSINPWVVAFVVFILGILVFFVIRGRFISTPTQIVPTLTPTATVTPTPIRSFSIIATQSAFLELEEALSTLSADLQLYSVQDPALSPPELTLPLNFSRL